MSGCDMNCQNCYYMEINPKEDKGHCYMFRYEVEGRCGQFKFSEAAKISIQKSVEKLSP